MLKHLLAAATLAASLATSAGVPLRSLEYARPWDPQTDDLDRIVGTWQRASPGQAFLYQWKFSHDGKYTWKFGTIIAPGGNAGSTPRADETETGTFKVTEGRIELTPGACRTEVKNRSLRGGGYTTDLAPAPARAYSWSIKTGESGQQVLKLTDAGTAPSGPCLPTRQRSALGYDYGDSGDFASVD